MFGARGVALLARRVLPPEQSCLWIQFRHTTPTLRDTLTAFQAPLDVESIIQPQFAHWIAPPIFEDSVGFLHFLRDLGLPAIAVSNVDRSDVETAIQFHGLVFDGLITSDDARAYKPRSEMFRMALELTSSEPNEVLHIGDSFGSDVRGAQPLGIPVAWLNRTERVSPGEPAPDYETRNLTDLHEIVRTIG